MKLKHFIPVIGAFLISKLDLDSYYMMCIYHCIVTGMTVIVSTVEIIIHYSK